MIEFEKIKLIIWDLDETLWSGTISEGEVVVKEQYVQFINDSLDCGIIHSICSKNDYDTIKHELSGLQLWDKFVFPSINWEPKGNRIKTIIDRMQLRAENVLFIDDNIQNLQEALFYCSQIMTAMPEEIQGIIHNSKIAEKKDPNHKRLEQYRLLEQKEIEQKKFKSNKEFLFSCNIHVKLCSNCLDEVDRIHELIMRSNQLNYTKFRHTKEDLILLLQDDNINAGYVVVSDKFGEYGIVGFYAIRAGVAIHYLFSCRTLGMMVEQYVYMKLGCPKINQVGDVVTKLNKKDEPQWINSEKKIISENRHNVKKKLLLKGPCDMSQIFSFIESGENVFIEFTYEGENGSLIEGHNTTGQCATALCLSEERKKEIISEFSWFDSNMLTTKMQIHKFDVVVMSLLPDGNLGLYRRKKTGEIIGMCEAYYDLTNTRNYNKYINGEIFTSNIFFKKKELERFAEEYEALDNSFGDITIRSLDTIYKYLSGSKLILLLGSEIEFPGKTYDSYRNRHLIHKKINRRVEKWAQDKENVSLMYFEKYMDGTKDYLDTINHFTKKVYFLLAQELIREINGESLDFYSKGKMTLFYEIIKQKFWDIKNRKK